MFFVLDGNPILRNGATGDWIGTYLGHKGAIWCARLSGDGSWAATSSADFSANVWNAQTGEVIVSLPHKHIVRTCDLNPGADKTYCIKKQPGKFRNSHTKDLRLVTASQDSVVRIWNIPEKRVEAQWSVVGASPSDSQSPKRVRAVLWVRNNIIVTVTFDGLVTWWEIEDPDDLKTKQDNERLLAVKKIRDLDLKGITGQVEHDLETITIAYNQNADVLNAVTGAVIKRVTLSYKPSAFSINPEKTQFITGCSNDTWVRVHDYETGALLETFKGHHGPVHSISYSPDGNVAASGGEDGTIRIWKMKPGPFGLWST